MCVLKLIIKKGIIRAILFAGAVALCTALVIWLGSSGKGLTITVQATVKTPTDDPYYVTDNGGYKDIRIPANDLAFKSSEAHDAPYRKVTMRNGTLVTGVGYGFYSVKGSISRNRLLEACPMLPLQEDWEFIVDMFNTVSSSDGKVSIYLDLVIYADSMTAHTTMYLFREGSAHPAIQEKDVEIGESFGFGIEY